MIPFRSIRNLAMKVSALVLMISGCASDLGGRRAPAPGVDEPAEDIGGFEPTISTVVGNGYSGFYSDGLFGVQTRLYFPMGMAYSPDGLLYFVDRINHRVRRVNTDQTVQTIYGSDNYTHDPLVEGPAVYANLNYPTDIFFESDGDMLVAAWDDFVITRVYLSDEAAGEEVTHSVIAGDGTYGYCCDGELATTARFSRPRSVVKDSAGNLVITDQGNNRIRRIDAETGVIETICNEAGTSGFSGDGGPAKAARIGLAGIASASPAGDICIDADDNIYLADTGNNLVRKIDRYGTITTIAGTGERSGPLVEGVSALEAALAHPVGVAVDTEGMLYIACEYDHTVRMVTPDGIISTLAGDGQVPVDSNENERFDDDEIGDGGPARSAHLNRPADVMVVPNGDVYVADSYNHRIRRISRFRVGA